MPGEVLENGLILRIRAQIILNCGIPVCAGGRWDPRRFRVQYRCLERDGVVSEGRLSFSGNTSEFLGESMLDGFGRYHLEITAWDPETGMAGRAGIDFSSRG